MKELTKNMSEILLEQYVSVSPADDKQIQEAKKAFKKELSNGPAKSVFYSNGISGTKHFGNFDLNLFHIAYDKDIEKAGLLNLFNDGGLFASRNCYGTIKSTTSFEDSNTQKYLKELWVLQFGKSDYTLTNVPAVAKTDAPDEIYRKLSVDKGVLSLLSYKFNKLHIHNRGNNTITTCDDLFEDLFNNDVNFKQFLEKTKLDGSSFETIKINICSFLALAILIDKLISSKKQYHAGLSGDSSFSFGEGYLTLNDKYYYVEVFIDKQISRMVSTNLVLRLAPKFSLVEGASIADMPLYNSVLHRKSPIWRSEKLNKLSDISETVIGSIVAEI